MILLNVCDVVKHFGPDPVLDGVTFEVRPGDKIGLVGPNGTGKTTLLKILAGQVEADRGEVELHASSRLGYLEQHPEFDPDTTVWQQAQTALEPLLALQREAEAAALALAAVGEVDSEEHQRLLARYERLQHELHRHDAYNLDHKIERILHGLGFADEAFQQRVGTLSGGQQNRLLLARLLLADPDVLLLDEPSNHLDIDATQWLEEFLAGSPQALVVVSHDRYFLDKVTNHTLELYHGTVHEYPGNFSAYWSLREERNKVLARTWEKQQTAIAKAEEFIRRNHYGQKAAQAKDREKKLLRIERVAPPRNIEGPVMGFPPASRTGDIVVRVEQLAKSYDRPLFAELTFDLLRGQRWGIMGPNGTGKSTLLKCIVGLVEADHGCVSLGSGVRIGYYDQLLSGLEAELPVVDAIRPAQKEFNEPQRRALLARFGLQGDAVFQPVGSLSGGERSRAALAQLSATDANFLILDEPTNHLDLWACDALERSINQFDGSVLLVSHDRYFLNRVVDHLLVVEPDRFRVMEGNYDTYVDTQRRRQTEDSLYTAPGAVKPAEKPAARVGRNDKPTRPKRRFPYRKVADIEHEIAQRESRIKALQAEMLEPDVLRDGRRVHALQTEIDGEKSILAQLYEHWEEASLLNG